MKDIIISLISSYGYLATTFLIAIENLIPPIPSEFILVFSGLLSRISNLNLILLILFSTLGSLLGAYILYFLGYYLGNKIIDSKIFGKLGFDMDKIKESVVCFRNNGYFSIFICRCIPMIRSLISIPAGIAKMNFLKFSILTFTGSFIWNTIFILLGNMFNKYSETVLNFMDKFFLPMVLLPLFIMWLRKKHKNI